MTSFSGNFSFFDNTEALNKSLSQALNIFDQINYNTLLHWGQQLSSFKPLVPVTLQTWAVWIGIMTFLLLTCVRALVICQFQAKLFSFIVSVLTEVERFHVEHEEELRRANEEEERRA